MSQILKMELVRRERGLLQREVAKQVKVHPSLISAVERGAVQPYPKLARGLSALLGLKPEQLQEPVEVSTNEQ